MLGGKKRPGKLRADVSRNSPFDYAVIRDEQGDPTGATRPMPDERTGLFGAPMKKEDLASPPSFQDGGEVKKSGMARVERGEVILPKDSAMDNKQGAKYEPILSLKDADISTSMKEQRRQADEAAKQGMNKQRAAEQKTMRDMAEKAGGTSKLAAPAVFKRGGVVKKTGMAHVEKGEVVLPEDHPMARDRVKSAMGGKAKKSKSKKGGKGGKKPHKVSVRRAANGGYIAENHYKSEPGEPPQEMEEHSLPDLQAVHDHMDEHMSPEEPAPAPEAAAGGPAPAPAGGAPPGGAPATGM